LESPVDGAWQHPAIFVVKAHGLKDFGVQTWLKQNIDRFSGEVFFPAHYPIQANEQATLKALHAQGFHEFVFCLSFDDPLMAVFGSSNILQLLQSLGMEEMEAIEHAMVTSAIQNARKKISEKVSYEKPARSLHAWFTLNAKS
jgi:hypothetical protein